MAEEIIEKMHSGVRNEPAPTDYIYVRALRRSNEA
jgi:hypothetical protein